MAYGYWRSGLADRESVFNLFFRQNPFGGSFSIACGLEYMVDFLSHFRFDADDTAFLTEVCGADGQPLFDRAFLDALESMTFSCQVDAIPEGHAGFSARAFGPRPRTADAVPAY